MTVPLRRSVVPNEIHREGSLKAFAGHPLQTTDSGDVLLVPQYGFTGMAFRRRVPFRLAALAVLLACSVQRSFSAFHCHDADMNGDGVPELVPTKLTIQVEESRDRISTHPFSVWSQVNIDAGPSTWIERRWRPLAFSEPS